MLMSKKTNKNKKPNNFYVLLWNMQFTVLEDFILKVIEQKNGCSDDEIADVLCLSKADISLIIGDDGIKDYVQGDISRRTLISDFTRVEYSITDSDERKYCQQDKLDYFKKFKKIDYKLIPKWLQEKKADEYYQLPNANEKSNNKNSSL